MEKSEEEKMEEMVEYLTELDITTLEQRKQDSEYLVKHESLCSSLMSVIVQYIEDEYDIDDYQQCIKKIKKKHFSVLAHYDDIDAFLVYTNEDNNRFEFDELLIDSKLVLWLPALKLVSMLATLILTNSYELLELTIFDKDNKKKIETIHILIDDFETETSLLRG